MSIVGLIDDDGIGHIFFLLKLAFFSLLLPFHSIHSCLPVTALKGLELRGINRRQCHNGMKQISTIVHIHNINKCFRRWKRQNLITCSHIIHAICLGKVGALCCHIMEGGFLLCRVNFLIHHHFAMQFRSLHTFPCLHSSSCCPVGNNT